MGPFPQLCLRSKSQFWSLLPFMNCLAPDEIAVFTLVPKVGPLLFSPLQLSTWVV